MMGNAAVETVFKSKVRYVARKAVIGHYIIARYKKTTWQDLGKIKKELVLEEKIGIFYFAGEKERREAKIRVQNALHELRQDYGEQATYWEL
jgi:hypothetical protein